MSEPNWFATLSLETNGMPFPYGPFIIPMNFLPYSPFSCMDFSARFHESLLEFAVVYHRVEQRNAYLYKQPGLEFPRLVEVGAAQNAVIYRDALPRCQQPHERPSQRTAVYRADVPSVLFQNVVLDFRDLLKHGGECGVFSFVEAIVGYCAYTELFPQQRYHLAEIRFPVASGPRKQHYHRISFIAEFVYFHFLPSYKLEMSNCFMKTSVS